MRSPDHYIWQWSTPSHSQSLESLRIFEQAAPFEQHSLQDIEWTLRHTRKAFSHRVACVVEPDRPVREGLSRPIVASTTSEQLVYVFTGQGSQFSGMASGIYNHYPAARAVIDQGCAYIENRYGVSLLPLLTQRSEANDAALQDTAMAQPALFVLAMSYLALLERSQLSCDALVGHSLGEFAVACYAGVWDYETALNVVFLRGRLMGSASSGAMLACQLSHTQLDEILGGDWSQRIDLAAINSQTQLVLSIPEVELNWVLEALQSKAVRYTRLKTSHAYHSRAMTPILPAFSSVIEQSCPQRPSRTWYSNVTGTEIDVQCVTTAQYWCEHLRQTVRFGDAVTNIAREYPNALFFEIGAKSQLSPVISEVTHSVAGVANDPERSGESQWLTTLATLWVHGFEIDWPAWRSNKGRRVPLPGIALAPQHYWADTKATVTQPDVVQAAHRQPANAPPNVKMLWSTILGIDVENLSDEDHFFALGGSSVDLLDLVRQISASGGQLSISDAYQCLHLHAMEEKVNGGCRGVPTDAPSQRDWILPFDLSRLSPQEITRITEQWKTRGENCGTLE